MCHQYHWRRKPEGLHLVGDDFVLEVRISADARRLLF